MMQIKKLFLALSRLEKTVAIGASFIFIFSLTIAGALYIQTNTIVKPAMGGEYREGLIGQPVFINPVVPTTNADRDIARLVFGSLWDISAGINDATAGVKHSPDGKTWNVRLKQNVLWQDGEPVTSDDVIFTLETIQNPESHSPLFQSFQGVSAERVSKLEVKFTLQSSYAFFKEEHLKSLTLIPKHIFGGLPVEHYKDSDYGLAPIGFGPYKVDGYDQDKRGIINSIHLSANKDYFSGAPYISNFVFKFYTDEGALVDAYNSNRIDGFGLTTSEKLTEIDGSSDHTVKIRHNIYALRSSRSYSIFINQAVDNKDLKNIAIREALNRTLDRDLIIKSVFGNYASPIYGPTVLSAQNTNEFDMSLLKGVVLNVTLSNEGFLVKTANLIKETWERSGAIVNLNILAIKDIQEKVLINSDYDLLLFGNTTGTSEDLYSFWHSTRRFYPYQNLALYQNKKVDAMLEAYRKDFGSVNNKAGETPEAEQISNGNNEKKRESDLKNISDAIRKDNPAVFLYSPDYIYITTPRLKGFDVEKEIHASSDRFLDIKNWYLKTMRVF